MNKHNTAYIIVIALVVVLVGIAGYVVMTNKPTQRVPVPVVTPAPTPSPVSPTLPPPTTTPPASLIYTNAQYGFNFTLPDSWAGYTIVTQNWTGTMVDDPTAKKLTGPEILIRHLLWTATTPRQDIPIMIFTLAQWDLVTKEKLSLGAAPIQPSELDHNAQYIFALPARYNYAFPTGYEEVDQILQGKPLQGF